MESYKDKDFYEKHRAIHFDKLTEMKEYEIAAYSKMVSFRYYDFVNAEGENSFNDSMKKSYERFGQ